MKKSGYLLFWTTALIVFCHVSLYTPFASSKSGFLHNHVHREGNLSVTEIATIADMYDNFDSLFRTTNLMILFIFFLFLASFFYFEKSVKQIHIDERKQSHLNRSKWVFGLATASILLYIFCIFPAIIFHKQIFLQSEYLSH